METYDFRKWSYDDRKMYQRIYKDLPFDPAIQSFFEEQNRFQERWRKRYDNYITLFCDLPANTDFDSCHPAFDRVVASKETLNIILRAVKELPETQQRRFVMQNCKSLLLKEIAAMEGVSQRSIERSLATAKRNLKKKLKNFS